MKTDLSISSELRPHALLANRRPRLGPWLLGTWLLSTAMAPAQTATEAWVRRYSNPEIPSSDYASKVVTDVSGNVIVAGYTDNGVSAEDMLIIKYSGVGVPLWTNRYNGPTNSDDRATAIAVDPSGNVFVLGSSSGSFSDYIIAYSGIGVPLWTNSISNAYGEAIAVDSSGNVFVTGSSPIGNFSDYATIAYSNDGVLRWMNHYDGPANSVDQATAIAVDSSGNVFVTGNSLGSTGHDYATIAYSNDGIELWTNRYTGPGNYDQATAIAVDSSGNVFVTGFSYRGNAPDYATIKYSGAGVPLWTNRYNGPGNDDDRVAALAVDSSGRVFVTGYSLGSGSAADYATIAYSNAGVPLWTNRYNGPGNGYDQATAIAVDSSGNVFVTGQSPGATGGPNHYDYATIKYSVAGVPLWTNRYNGPGDSDDGANALAVDSSGKVFVTGYSYDSASWDDYATIAYSNTGAPLWTNRYNGPGNDHDYGIAVAVDSSSKVFVTGSSLGSGSGEDYATIAYSNAGVPLWTNRYNGPGDSDDGANAIAVDYNGKVFVTGYSAGSGSGKDYATIAYSNAGVPLWTNRYDGPTNSDDLATGIGVDSSGNVFVTGYSSRGISSDYTTIKYSGAGVPLWTNRYNGEVTSSDPAAAIAVDSSGNVFVTGSYATIRYSGTGVPLWTNFFSDPAAAIAVDSSGNVFVTGYSSGNYATIKYSGAGVPLWTNRYNEPGYNGAYATALAVDSSGNVFVTGYSTTTNNPHDYDYATVAYSGVGVPLWTNRYDGPANDWDVATAIAVDSKGNVVVTGHSSSTYGYPKNYDYATIAYSGAGVPLWTNRYNGPANGDETTWGKFCLAIGPDGAVYVTGASDGDYSEGPANDYATVKYSANLEPIQLTIEPDGSGGYFIRFTGVPGASYRLQRAPSVTGPWNSSAPQTAPASGLVEFWDLFPPPGRGFYRTVQP